MREIKFRAWDKEKEIMGFFDFYNPSTKHFLDWEIPYGEYELMQYTELKDKNGKEIYEGDILKLPEWTSNTDRKGSPITIYEVKIPKIYYDSYDDQLGEQYSEVIDNIYENPELLK